jgi:hypothetical protein
VLFAWRHHSQTTRTRMASIRTKSRKSAAAPTDCFTRRAERSKRFAESIAEGNHRPSRASLYTTLGIIFVFTLAGVVAMNLSKTELGALLPPLPNPGSFGLGALTAWTISWLCRERPPRPQRTRTKDIWLD